ncbi:MAG: metallophosphoesterase [Candidatus Bathyarchaeia archaeon]
MGKIKTLFVTDVHGSETVFRKFLNASKIYKVDAAIIGGDITGKGLSLVAKTSRGYQTDILGRKWNARNEKELQVMIRDIRKRGFYVHIDEPAALEEIKSSQTKAELLLENYMKKTLEEWLQLAEERLKKLGIKCYISPGNDDIYEIDEIINSSNFVINPDGKVVQLSEDHEMISMGKANITPWNCPRDVTEEELAKTIDTMISELDDPSRSVFNFHAPPFDTYLDVAPELDKDLRPVLKTGQPSMISAGSTSVRRAIEEYQPVLGLHGHIHESKGVERIGKSLCINPGSDYFEGILRGAIIILEGGKVKNYMFIGG